MNNTDLHKVAKRLNTKVSVNRRDVINDTLAAIGPDSPCHRRCRCGANFISASDSHAEVFMENSVCLLCEEGHHSMAFNPITSTSEIMDTDQWRTRLVENRCVCPECRHRNLKWVDTRWSVMFRGTVFRCKRKHLSVFPDENRFRHDITVLPLPLYVMQNYAEDPADTHNFRCIRDHKEITTSLRPARSHMWRMLDTYVSLLLDGPQCISELVQSIRYSTQTVTRAVTDLHQQTLINFTMRKPSRGGHPVRVWYPILKQKP